MTHTMSSDPKEIRAMIEKCLVIYKDILDISNKLNDNSSTNVSTSSDTSTSGEIITKVGNNNDYTSLLGGPSGMSGDTGSSNNSNNCACLGSFSRPSGETSSNNNNLVGPSGTSGDICTSTSCNGRCTGTIQHGKCNKQTDEKISITINKADIENCINTFKTLATALQPEINNAIYMLGSVIGNACKK